MSNPFAPPREILLVPPASRMAEFAEVRPLANTPPHARGAHVDILPGESLGILKARNSSEQGEGIGVTLGLTTDDRLVADEGPRDAFVWPRVRAHLEWGAGDTTVSAVCDFLSGTAFTVTGETVTIGVEYDVVIPPWQCWTDPCCAPSFRASAMLSYGGCGHGAQLTELAQIKDHGDAVTIPVPQFATSFAVLPCAGARVTVDVLPCGRGYRVPDVIVPLSNLGQHNTIYSVPNFNGARHLQVFNRGDQPAFAFVVFKLAF